MCLVRRKYGEASPSVAPLGAMRPSTADSTITIVSNRMEITMSTIEARVEVLAAAEAAALMLALAR